MGCCVAEGVPLPLPPLGACCHCHHRCDPPAAISPFPTALLLSSPTPCSSPRPHSYFNGLDLEGETKTRARVVLAGAIIASIALFALLLVRRTHSWQGVDSAYQLGAALLQTPC